MISNRRVTDNTVCRLIVTILHVCRWEHISDDGVLLKELLQALGVSVSDRKISRCVCHLLSCDECRLCVYGRDGMCGLVLTSDEFPTDVIEHGSLIPSYDQ